MHSNASFDFLGGVMSSSQRASQAVNNALFALVAENTSVLHDIASQYVSDANPFIAYEAQKLVAEATHATSVVAAGKTYVTAQSGHDEAYQVQYLTLQSDVVPKLNDTSAPGTPASSDYDQEMEKLEELEVLSQYQQQLIQDGYKQAPASTAGVSTPLPEAVASRIPDAAAHQQTIYGQLDDIVSNIIYEHMKCEGGSEA